MLWPLRRYFAVISGSFSTALRVLGNAEDAEDALQDGLLSAYRNLKRFEGRSQFSTWLTRIVINAALMKRRSAKSRPAISLDETQHEDELPAAERIYLPMTVQIRSRFMPGQKSAN